MRITSEADYAVRIVYCLASEGGKLGAKEISERIDVTPRFCLKILRKLVHTGTLKSYKGSVGGYALAKPARDITVREVVCAIDGPILLNKCLDDQTAACTQIAGCSCKFRTIWSDLSKKVEDSLDEVNFEMLTNDE